MDQIWPEVEQAGLVRKVTTGVLRAVDPSEAARRCALAVPAEVGSFRLLAVGKAAVPMASAALEACGERISGALVVTTEHPGAAALSARAEVWVGDHPLPTERNVRAAERVLGYGRALAGSDQFLLTFLSGGGSALLTLPEEGIELADIVRVTEALMRAGCPIAGLNRVRSACERLKGGRLGEACLPARVLVCVVSDVIGDPLSVVASGPFVPSERSAGDAMTILAQFGCVGVSDRIDATLRARMAHAQKIPAETGPSELPGVEHRVALNNRDAVRAASAAMERADFPSRTLGPWTGEAREGARTLAAALRECPLQRGRGAVVMGGEPVVSGVGEGALGGRMQESALALALELEGSGFGWLAMGLATDGRDGPTDAAGAAVDGAMLARARAMGLDLGGALARHETHAALRAMGALIVTGPTGTNVNDVLVGVRWEEGEKPRDGPGAHPTEVV